MMLDAEYTMAGGKPVNVARKAQQIAEEKKLPGKGMLKYLADSHDKDETNIARKKISEGKEITKRERNLVSEKGNALVMGMITPPKAGTREFQELSNEVFELGLKNKKNFINKAGKIDLGSIGRVEELAKNYLSKPALKDIQKNTKVADRIGTYLEELEILTKH